GRQDVIRGYRPLQLTGDAVTGLNFKTAASPGLDGNQHCVALRYHRRTVVNQQVVAAVLRLQIDWRAPPNRLKRLRRRGRTRRVLPVTRIALPCDAGERSLLQSLDYGPEAALGERITLGEQPLTPVCTLQHRKFLVECGATQCGRRSGSFTFSAGWR